jgi:hypothetical protein
VSLSYKLATAIEDILTYIEEGMSITDIEEEIEDDMNDAIV